MTNQSLIVVAAAEEPCAVRPVEQLQDRRDCSGNISEASGKEHARNGVVLATLGYDFHAGKSLLGAGRSVEFYRHGHQCKERCKCKEHHADNRERVAKSLAHAHQHDADNHKPRTEIRTDVCGRHNSRTQPQREIAFGMLDSVTDFVSGDACGTCITAMVNFGRQVERLVQRVVMVRQESLMLQHLHIGNARFHEDCLCDIGTGKAARNMNFLSSRKAGFDKQGNGARKDERHHENHHV